MKDSILSICNKEKFDFVGDIHGCYEQLIQLLGQLGYSVNLVTFSILTSPEDRVLVFLGDLTDRGEDLISVLRLVMRAVEAKQAICLRGNHDDKLYRALIGKKVNISEGLRCRMSSKIGFSLIFGEKSIYYW